MAKRRRRRRGLGGLGLPAAEHGPRAVARAKDVQVYLRRMRSALAGKNLNTASCGIAFEHFTRAAWAAGAAATEGIGTGLIRQTKRTSRLRGFGGMAMLKKAAARFHRACAFTPRG